MSAFELAALVHTCDTQRNIPERNSRGELIPMWVDGLTAEPCRYVVKEEKISQPGESLQMETVYLLLFGPEADILPSDQIRRIVIEGGQVLQGPFPIEAVLPRRLRKKLHHISVKLEKIQ